MCALLAAKDHVNVFLYDGGIVPDPDGIITAGHHNKTARTVAVHRGETINAPALTAMFWQIIANNRAGGWRKLKRAQETLSALRQPGGETGTSRARAHHRVVERLHGAWQPGPGGYVKCLSRKVPIRAAAPAASGVLA